MIDEWFEYDWEEDNDEPLKLRYEEWDEDHEEEN